MLTYVFKCPVCGHREESTSRDVPPFCTLHIGAEMKRDYKAEGVGLTGIVLMKKEREAGGRSAIRDLFLPKQEDFASAEDPDGNKGMRGWLEEHGPRETNKKPLYPEHKREVF